MPASPKGRSLLRPRSQRATTQSVRESGVRSGVAVQAEARGIDLASALGWWMAFLGFLVGSRVIRDNSFLTHLATGDQILSAGSVPSVDPYSFTAGGEAWTVQSWLPSLIYSALHQTAGLWAVRVFTGVLTALIIAGMWRLSAPARSLVPRALLTGAVVTLGAVMWSPRPLLVGLLALCVLILVQEKHLSPWWLIPTMWVWVNSHGSFPLAFAFMGATAVGAAIDQRGLPRWELRVIGWLTVGTLIGGINPVGPRLLVFPIELLGRSEALKDVAEWASPTFKQPAEWIFLMTIFGLVAAAKLGLEWRRLLPAFGFVVAGLLAVRNINPAMLVIVAGIAPALAALPGSLTGRERGSVPTAVGALSIASVVALVALISTAPALSLSRFPVEEVDWLEERGLVANADVRVVHRDIVGNYLEFRFGEDANVFFDDRYDFFPIELVEDHAELFFGGDFAGILDRYDADVVLWATDSEFADWLREDNESWTVELDGEDWLVALRVEP